MGVVVARVLDTIPTTLPRSSTSGPPLDPTAKSTVVVNIVLAWPSARCTNDRERMPSVSE
jgi:hypothetical protein